MFCNSFLKSIKNKKRVFRNLLRLDFKIALFSELDVNCAVRLKDATLSSQLEMSCEEF